METLNKYLDLEIVVGMLGLLAVLSLTLLIPYLLVDTIMNYFFHPWNVLLSVLTVAGYTLGYVYLVLVTI